MKALSPYSVLLLTCSVLTIPFTDINAQITVATSTTVRVRNTAQMAAPVTGTSTQLSYGK